MAFGGLRKLASSVHSEVRRCRWSLDCGDPILPLVETKNISYQSDEESESVEQKTCWRWLEICLVVNTILVLSAEGKVSAAISENNEGKANSELTIMWDNQ